MTAGAAQIADDRCPACGEPAACGMRSGMATCWCFALPQVLPLPPDASAARCYCAKCLAQRIGEPRSTGAASRSDA